MIAADVIVPSEVSIFLAEIPEPGSMHAMDQCAVIQHGQVKTAAIPGDQLRRVFFDSVEKALHQLRLGLTRLTQRPDTETIVITQRTGNGDHAMQMKGQEIIAARFSFPLER